MRLAIFADIHANRQAFGACLEAARARGAERMICLGDYVGYGADPEWTVDTVMGLVDSGAIAVREAMIGMLCTRLRPASLASYSAASAVAISCVGR